MPTYRKPLSKSGWLLLFIIFVAVIAVVILATIGYVSLAWLSDGLVNLALWASLSAYNVALLFFASFGFGMVVLYFLKAYIIGTNISPQAVAQGAIAQGYNPPPTYPSVQPEKKQETEIS